MPELPAYVVSGSLFAFARWLPSGFDAMRFFATGLLAASCTSCCANPFAALCVASPSDVVGLAFAGEPDSPACVYHDPVPCVYFFFPAEVGVVGLLIGGDMGREKLMLLLLLPCLSRSGLSVTFDNLFVGREVAGGGMLALSALDPLPPPRGEGDVMRCGGSKLADLLCPSDTFLGNAGTGGASGAGDTGPSFRPPGEGERNVRSVMDPPLFCRIMPPLPGPPRIPPPITLPLPTDETDPRRTIRFVTRLPTGSGDVVFDRRAAAAAAEEREALDVELCRKACPAAAVAALIVALSIGCRMSVSMLATAFGFALGAGHVSLRTGLADEPGGRRRDEENMLGMIV